MKPQRALMKVLLIMTPAVMLAGCGNSGPANVAGLKRVVRTDLLGARGLTDADQRRSTGRWSGFVPAVYKAPRNERGTISPKERARGREGPHEPFS